MDNSETKHATQLYLLYLHRTPALHFDALNSQLYRAVPPMTSHAAPTDEPINDEEAHFLQRKAQIAAELKRGKDLSPKGQRVCAADKRLVGTGANCEIAHTSECMRERSNAHATHILIMSQVLSMLQFSS